MKRRLFSPGIISGLAARKRRNSADRGSVTRAGLGTKLFLSMFGLCLLLFFGMLYTGMKNAQRALVEQKSADMSALVGRTGQFLDVYLQNISGVLYSAMNSEGFFSGSESRVQQILKRHVNANPSLVSQLYYALPDGRTIASDPLAFEIIGNPHLRRLAGLSTSNPELILWSKPYYSPLLAETTVAFSLAARDEEQRTQGLLIAEINLSRLTEQLSRFFAGQDQTFVILNEDGEVLSYARQTGYLSQSWEAYPGTIKAELVPALAGLSNGVQQFSGPFGDKLAVRSNNNRLGWSIIALTDARVFQESVRTLQNQFLLIGCVSLLLLLLLTWAISRAFARPIRLLALHMDRIREERLWGSAKALERSDEIGQLSRSFDAMMTRIQELMEKQRQTEARKKRSELKMLMSQIRPHFLYNTLNSIGQLARQRRSSEVEETIRSLIRLLTLSIDKQEEQIPLADELAGLNAYVQIQNIRYGDKIRLALEVPPEDQPYLVPRLVLQPLVENAIFHGFGGRPSGVVTVRSIVDEQTLCLFVVDDGAGLDVGRVRRLLARAGEEPEPSGPGRLRSFNHIGLANVQERIRLLYGEPYGLFFEPQPATGAEVEVRLPLLLPAQGE